MRLIDKLRSDRGRRFGRPRKQVEYTREPEPHPLREFFLQLGIKQAALAEHLGVNPGLLSGYLHGTCLVPVEVDRALRELAAQIEAEEAVKKI